MFKMISAALAFFMAAVPALADDKDQGRGPEYLGTWRMVAVVVDGKDTPVASSILMTVTNDGYTVTVDGKPYQKGRAKAVGEGIPRRSDLIITEGPGAGTTVPQITRVDGDVMLGCQSKGERPAEFTSKPGSGHSLSLWIRSN